MRVTALVTGEDLLQRIGDLAHRGPRPAGLHGQGQQIALAGSRRLGQGGQGRLRCTWSRVWP